MCETPILILNHIWILFFNFQFEIYQENGVGTDVRLYNAGDERENQIESERRGERGRRGVI